MADLSLSLQHLSNGAPFSEAPVWRSFGNGWTQLFGSFQKVGVSFEWHEFTTTEPLEWGKSFHPESVEICLNVSGTGSIAVGKSRVELVAHSAGFYHQGTTPLSARRSSRERHQFVTVEYSVPFLENCFAAHRERLHPVVRGALENKGNGSAVSNTSTLTGAQLQLVHALRNPPVLSCALPIWYESKALELAATFFFEASGELFCERQQRVGQERVEKLIAILRENLVNPPTLEQLGAQVGCSPFYLSRTFSKQVGMTLPQFIRKLRMERAAELLRGGRHNVTEAAFEVGYSSLSHFSQAFHETFGVCPGLYPILPTKGGRRGIEMP